MQNRSRHSQSMCFRSNDNYLFAYLTELVPQLAGFWVQSCYQSYNIFLFWFRSSLALFGVSFINRIACLCPDLFFPKRFNRFSYHRRSSSFIWLYGNPQKSFRPEKERSTTSLFCKDISFFITFDSLVTWQLDQDYISLCRLQWILRLLLLQTNRGW